MSLKETLTAYWQHIQVGGCEFRGFRNPLNCMR
jgi:hypothetical protein